MIIVRAISSIRHGRKSEKEIGIEKRECKD